MLQNYQNDKVNKKEIKFYFIFFKIIQKKEIFCKIRDQLIIYNNYSVLKRKCPSCKNINHFFLK